MQSSLSDFYCLKHCHFQSRSCSGRRQAAKEQLAVNYPLPNHPHPHFRHSKSRHPSHLQGERGGGQNKAWRLEKTSKSRETAFNRAAERVSAAPSMQLLKSPVHLRGSQRRRRIQVCCVVPSLLPAAWEGCTGISLLGPVGHASKTQSGSSNSLRFCTCCNSELLWPEPIPQQEPMGCKPSRQVNSPPGSVPALS